MSPQETNKKKTAAPALVVSRGGPGPVDPRALANLKHGLTGARLYFQDQDQVNAYMKLRRELLAQFAPASAREEDLANQLICDRWRLTLAAELDTKIMSAATCDSDHATFIAEAKTWLAHGEQISRIALYEGRIQSRYQKTLAEFDRLQAERKAAVQAALEEAAQLAELAESEGETASDEAAVAEPFITRNFEFSAPEIAQMLTRYRRLKRAKALRKVA